MRRHVIACHQPGGRGTSLWHGGAAGTLMESRGLKDRNVRGVVVGDTFDAFVETHKPVLTGQQFQGPNSTPDPVYILFEDFTHVKFYRLSLRASVELDAGPFEDGPVPVRTGSCQIMPSSRDDVWTG